MKPKRYSVKGSTRGGYIEVAPASAVVKFKKLHPDAQIPKYATTLSAGCDLVSVEDVDLANGEIRAISTGLAIQLPVGYEAQVRPRSGLSLKGFTVANSPGTIDGDFTGLLKVIVRWEHPYPFEPKGHFRIEKGMRIAQLVIVPLAQVSFEEVGELDETERGENGFGSSGLF